ncbi:von Willebrand factor A domain-containing protein 7-like, partial [Mustelus asterias]
MPGVLPFLLPSGLCLWILATSPTAMGFNPNFGQSVTHSDITKMAALRIVLRLFQEIPNPEGKVLPKEAFQLEDQKLRAENIFEAYYESKVSARRFKQALKVITNRNTLVDFKYALAAERHFDSENLREGKQVLLREKAQVIQNILRGNYHQAQKHMGTMLHTLQDFYSHSNWVELGFQTPNSKLIKAGEAIGRVAGKNEETCIECSPSPQCVDEILGSVLKEKIITTGYFSLNPHGRPEGKCSHGGKADLSKKGNQGINKDSLISAHGQYHREAARVAMLASLELFQDVWDTVGHQHFLRFFNIESLAGLSFVLDTTGSMKEDIDAAKERTIRIVDNRRRSKTQPSFYILVPFNDP